MFQLTEELGQKIEGIQTAAFLSLNINPDDVLEHNKERNHKSAQKKKMSLEEEYAKLESFHLFMPEHHYDTSLEYFKFLHSCGATKYDRIPFLQRFTNIIQLCHEVFTDGDPSQKKNIILTTLPFLNVNGICLRNNPDTDIVFINEGILSILPKIYRYLLPILNPLLFGKGSRKNNLPNVLDIITSLCLSKKMYKQLREDRDVKFPHANETWLVQDFLMRRIEKNNLKSKNPKDNPETNEENSLNHPVDVPLNDKMAHFLACRGAYVYLIGHELSHSYNNHAEIKVMEGINLRDPKMIKDLSLHFKNKLSQIEGASVDNRNFCIHQPIEEEADAHGFHCISKYCADNDLDDQKSLCVYIGAIATFTVMEIYDCLSVIHHSGSKLAKVYYSTHPVLRNILFRGEHPSPLTRLSMLLLHENFKDSPITKILMGIDKEMKAIATQIRKFILENSTKVEDILKSSEMLNMDIDKIFQKQSCLGSSDLSNEFISEFLAIVSPSKKS